MYVFFVVQAVLAALHAAVAQAPFFQLACPEAGFIVGSHHIVKCTVRGQNVTGAGCVAPVSSVKLETVNSVVINTIGYSIYPTCETSWSHSGNDKGRCVAIDTNNIYTYEFNVTADRAILTNDTGLRCYADCATGPGLPNPLTYNSSESCGPPVKFVEQTTTVPPSTSESVPPTSSTSPPANPCLGQTCGHGTQENKPGCPCDCYPFWGGTHCTDFCWWCLLLILFAAVFIIIICCLCHHCGNVEIRCCCKDCWIRCHCGCCCARVLLSVVLTAVIGFFCYEHVANNREGGPDEEAQCKCVYRKRPHSGNNNSEPLNRMEPVKDGDLDGSTAAEQPKPAVSSAPVSNSDHKRSGKKNQEKLETQEKEEEPSNKSSFERPMVYPKTSTASGKEQREKNHSLPGASMVGVQSTGLTTIPPLTPVNGNSYTKKTDPLPPIAKQSNK